MSPTDYKVYYRNSVGTRAYAMIAQFRSFEDAKEYAQSKIKRISINERRPDALHWLIIGQGGRSPQIMQWAYDAGTVTRKTKTSRVRFKVRGQQIIQQSEAGAL